MHRARKSGLALAAAVFTGLAGFASTPAAACPPSEGELDLEQVDLSGDGQVMLPESVRWKVLPKTSTTDSKGHVVVDDRVALVLADIRPAKAAGADGTPACEGAERHVLTMKMGLTAAGEVRDWLATAVQSQEQFLKDAKAQEPAGMTCTLNARQCREASKEKKLEMPAMWVSVSSQNGARQHGWTTARTQAAPKACGAPAADNRITLTAYQSRAQAAQPLQVKMDLPTAKALLADLNTAIDQRTGKPATDKSGTTPAVEG